MQIPGRPFLRRICLSLFSAVLLNPLLAKGDYAISDIIAAAKAANAQFTNLRIVFVNDSPSPSEMDISRRKITAGIFLLKQPEGWERLELRRIFIDPKTKVQTPFDGPDLMSVFDGSATTRLIPKYGSVAITRAIIYPGRHDVDFPETEIPHSWVYRMSPAMTFEQTFAQGGLAISPQNETVGGTPILRVEGLFEGSQSIFRFAPSKGFLLLNSEMPFVDAQGAKRKYIQENTHVVQLDNGVWYPKTIRYGFVPPNDGAITFDIKEISTAELKASDFKLSIPAKTQVDDLIAKQVYVKLSGATASTEPANTADKSSTELDQYIQDAAKQIQVAK
jgi:hypothetical protein